MEKACDIASMLFPDLHISSIFKSADKSLPNLSDRYKLLKIVRYILALSLYSIQFFFRLLLSRLPLPPESVLKPTGKNESPPYVSSGIGRALFQILSAVNDVPFSSRKYELVRDLAEKVIDENCRAGGPLLEEVNRVVLSAAFSITLGKLEASVFERERKRTGWAWPADGRFGRVFGAVRVLRGAVRSRTEEEMNRVAGSAEKLAGEILWLGEKMAACGGAGETVLRWGSASKLARLSLSAEPRLQGILVRVSVFLFKHVKELEGEEVSKRDHAGRMKMLMSWLPLLCRAGKGADAPTLSSLERAETEKTLDEIVDKLSNNDQEKVLALWLYHFTSNPNSDWPNLRPCYFRWCAASRKLLLAQSMNP